MFVCLCYHNLRGGRRRRAQLSADPNVGLDTARPRGIGQDRVVVKSVHGRVGLLGLPKRRKVRLGRVGESKSRDRGSGRHDGYDRVEAGERRCQQRSGLLTVRRGVGIDHDTVPSSTRPRRGWRRHGVMGDVERRGCRLLETAHAFCQLKRSTRRSHV